MNLKDIDEFVLISNEMPRIADKLVVFWGNKEFDGFVNHLLSDNIDGKRQGFPHHIGAALFKLMRIHEELFPQFYSDKTIWSDLYLK